MKKRGKKNALAKQRAPGSAAESEALPAGLLKDVRYLIEQARQRVAGAVNAELTGLYWRIGRRIQHDILHEDRAAYGEQILSTLSTELSWSHFVEIIPLKDDLHRDFYAEMC
ncbi:MAG: hypothetical protein KAY24_19145, partial [Candidatus Eisenbacteria sp.]|nr:hypothetical protein [Candidatus Eisenbacteria bacterium]